MFQKTLLVLVGFTLVGCSSLSPADKSRGLASTRSDYGTKYKMEIIKPISKEMHGFLGAEFDSSGIHNADDYPSASIYSQTFTFKKEDLVQEPRCRVSVPVPARGVNSDEDSAILPAELNLWEKKGYVSYDGFRSGLTYYSKTSNEALTSQVFDRVQINFTHSDYERRYLSIHCVGLGLKGSDADPADLALANLKEIKKSKSGKSGVIDRNLEEINALLCGYILIAR